MGVESLALIDQAEVNSLDHSKQGKLLMKKNYYIRRKLKNMAMQDYAVDGKESYKGVREDDGRVKDWMGCQSVPHVKEKKI